jgi:hypothetical protein
VEGDYNYKRSFTRLYMNYSDTVCQEKKLYGCGGKPGPISKSCGGGVLRRELSLTEFGGCGSVMVPVEQGPHFRGRAHLQLTVESTRVVAVASFKISALILYLL